MTRITTKSGLIILLPCLVLVFAEKIHPELSVASLSSIDASGLMNLGASISAGTLIGVKHTVLLNGDLGIAGILPLTDVELRSNARMNAVGVSYLYRFSLAGLLDINPGLSFAVFNRPTRFGTWPSNNFGADTGTDAAPERTRNWSVGIAPDLRFMIGRGRVKFLTAGRVYFSSRVRARTILILNVGIHLSWQQVGSARLTI